MLTSPEVVIGACCHEQGLPGGGISLQPPIGHERVTRPVPGFLQHDPGQLPGPRRRQQPDTTSRGLFRGDLTVLTAEVPLARMFGYSTHVRSLSQGRASYSMEPLKYDLAPPSVLEEMMG